MPHGGEDGNFRSISSLSCIVGEIQGCLGSYREDKLKSIILPDLLQWLPRATLATRDVGGKMVASSVALDVHCYSLGGASDIITADCDK